MFLIKKIKNTLFGGEEDENKEDEKKKEKKIHINELNDEVWIYKNEYALNKELDEDYLDDMMYDHEEEEEDADADHLDKASENKEHFLDVPLFDKDEYGREIKRNLRYPMYRKRNRREKDNESNRSEEYISSSEKEDEEDDEDMEEPFLNLYEELKREQEIREYYNPMLRPRLWCFDFLIKYIHNLETQKQKHFYLISFGSNEKIQLFGDLRKEVSYTPGYRLEPGEIKYLTIPLAIWSNKYFKMSYNDLPNFEINIEMWETHGFIFNTMAASAKKTMKDIIEVEPDRNIVLSKKIEEKKISFEIQRIGVYMQLSEVFEFHLALDSWWFISDSKMPTYLKNFPKFLRFKFPLNSNDWIIHSSYKSQNNFWLYPAYFCFVGTHQQLADSFFIVTVLCANSKYRYRPPILLGSCIISLKSILEYPVFKGIVKKLTLDKSKFRQGDIVGNIKCFTNSFEYGATEQEETIARPSQPLSGYTLVNQLNLNDHYLIVRINRCDNLALSNVDLNNVNVNVWVKWDGIINKTNICTKSTSPSFYQNLYFPIRLTDKKELTNPLLIENVLALDLISRGEICIEVHNNSDLYSVILGIVEIKFSDIFNHGTVDFKSLIETNMRETNRGEGDLNDDYETPYRTTEFRESYYDDFYKRTYKTTVYKNTLELMYSNLHLKSLNRGYIRGKKESTISVEAFVIPPLPNNLVFLDNNETGSRSVLYRSLSKRWKKDFVKFNDSYLQWFPKAIRKRSFPCISKNDFDNKIYPLCSYITSVNLPAQVSTPGTLLHWINNIEYIENEDDASIFTPPYFFLSYKKGTIQDHALLLCCCLRGMEYDAYVCKGTIHNGKKDHYWVLTRHKAGWISFWEVTTKSIIHLRNRWGTNVFLNNAQLLKQQELLNKMKEKNEEKFYTGEYLANFIRFGLHELKKREEAIKREYEMKEENALYQMHMYGEHNTKDEQVNIDEILMNDEELFNNVFEISMEKNETYTSSNILKYLLDNFSNYIPISPKFYLLDYHSTLSYVPYSSIEVVFNENQLFGNVQNHHPACILYDFENTNQWRAFLNHAPVSIKSELTVSTPLQDKVSMKYTSDLEEEVREMITFIRNKEGLETKFENCKTTREFLEMYIDLCEYKLNLDNNYNPKPENYEWKEKKKKEAMVKQMKNKFEKEKKIEMGTKLVEKQGWSQYKNDFYPNIEAQYINKEFDDMNEYHVRPQEMSKMDFEQKKQLTQIPPDFVYGMNEEVYGKGKPKFINNYVFKRDNKDILNNFDVNISKQNKKRFQTTTVHYKERVDDSSVGDNEYIKNEQSETEEVDQREHDKNKQPTNIPEKKRYDKFMNKYNKKYNYIEKIKKKLRKKEKIMKEEIMQATLQENQNKKRNGNKEVIRSFIDTHEYLTKVMNASSSYENNSKDTLHSNDQCFIPTNSNCSYNGFFYIPYRSKENQNEPNEIEMQNQKDINISSDKSVSLSEHSENENQINETETETETETDTEIETENKKETDTEIETENKKETLYKRNSSMNLKSALDKEIRPELLNHKKFQQNVTHHMYMSEDQRNVISNGMNNNSPYVDVKEPMYTNPYNNYQENYNNMGMDPHHNNQQYIAKNEEGFGNNNNYYDNNSMGPEYNTNGREFMSIQGPMLDGETSDHSVRPPKTWSRLDASSAYVVNQIHQWNWYYSMEQQYFNWQYYKFPVPPNHTFVGFPIHFSTTDINEIKSFLLHSKRFENIMKLSIHKISFLIYCKVYPLIGGIMSNWLFLGCLVPWLSAHERETKIMRKQKKNYNKR